MAPKWHQPYAQEWSLDIQREISPNLLLDIGYYGNTSTHLPGIVDINQPLPGAYVTALAPYGVTPPVTYATTPQLNYIRPYRGYDAINSFETIFSSNYNGLQIALQKRFGTNSFINVNYTYSHALTNGTSDFQPEAESPLSTAKEEFIAGADGERGAIPFRRRWPQTGTNSKLQPHHRERDSAPRIGCANDQRYLRAIRRPAAPPDAVDV